jgi:hypothetical protein
MPNDFEKLQVIICYIFAVVDVNYIPIIAPFINSTSYYCWKGFYLVLLQGVVDAKCNFWIMIFNGFFIATIEHYSKNSTLARK